MFSERYAKLFWSGLALNLWVSFASTFLAAVFALFGALAIRKTFVGKTLCNFIYSLNLPMPHLVVRWYDFCFFSKWFVGKASSSDRYDF